MVFAFPFHDPDNKYGPLLHGSVDALKKRFSSVCVSATPSTIRKNPGTIHFLREQGFLVVENKEGSSVGDHYRQALAAACDIPGSRKIFFGFIDRTLFCLNTDFCDEFSKSLQEDFSGLLLFERSAKAWVTHPGPYREIETATNKLGSFLLGTEIELATCGFLIDKNLAKQVIPLSIETSYSAGTEWILSAFLLGFHPIVKKVPWLSWEDPFIEGRDATVLKEEREHDPVEIAKRLEMNLPITQLLSQKRFLSLVGKHSPHLNDA